MLRGKRPSRYFNEGGYISWISFFQLLACAILAWRIFKLHKGKLTFSTPKSSYRLWSIIALGFLFLAIDEVVEIHERIEDMIFQSLNLEETSFTRRIDDLIVGSYGLIAVGILYFYKEEIKKYSQVIPIFVCGFILMFAMVIFDLVSNKSDLLFLLIGDESFSEIIKHWLRALEETLKIFSEGVFIGALYRCLQISRRFPAVSRL
ncbi:MAG: hypothetical protein F6K16_16705 [Symploca sp. SIO2B6]|nr:hypothetical protein [Symploca sp. SIO2B6]